MQELTERSVRDSASIHCSSMFDNGRRTRGRFFLWFEEEVFNRYVCINNQIIKLSKYSYVYFDNFNIL